MQHETFLDLARTWKYCGLPGSIEFQFAMCSLSREDWIKRVSFMLEKYSLQDVEAYFTATIVSAVVPGAITYTLSGGRNESKSPVPPR